MIEQGEEAHLMTAVEAELVGKLLSSEEHIAQFFAFNHLPPRLAAISKPFAILAASIIEVIPRNPERTVALRKLLEGKDAAVRAALAKP